jgi:hypothetical protein
MKTRLHNVFALFLLLIIPMLNFAQAPPLGVAADFVLFSTIGAVGNTGISQLTGNVGTNNGDITGFGNVNGNMHNADGITAQCAFDLQNAYNLLAATINNFTIASPIGNGDTLVAGVYSIPGSASTLADTLFLDGDENDVFILKVDGTLSSNPNSKVVLLNGALACNVFWTVGGLVSMASGTTMRGTIIANNAAINFSIGDTLEGRALSTEGAVNVSGVMAYIPVGCNSPVLLGPSAPALGNTSCYTLFSSIGGGGGVTDDGTSVIKGDVGTNSGLTTGYNPLLVDGMIHPIPDISTGDCANDLGGIFTYLNTLPYDIQLMYPAQFGNNLVLTPHTYLLNGAVTFNNSLYLNAMGNEDAVFVIQVTGAFTTSTYSEVFLINGTKPENVFWKIDGAIEINDYSVFNGTIASAGAIALKSGVTLNGRALTTSGALTSVAITATMPPGCYTPSAPLITSEPTIQNGCEGDSISFTVIATGTDLTYQWRKGTVELADGGNISGANTDILTIDPISLSDAATNYNVIVSGLLEPNDTSINATLEVDSIPIIITEPSNQNICGMGEEISFMVEATGSNLNYQWKKGTEDLVDGDNISGANSEMMTIDPVGIADIGDDYYVVVGGTCSPNDTSIFVSLQVSEGPIIIDELEDQIVCDETTISIIVEASGSGLSYQWRNGDIAITDDTIFSGSTTNTLTINLQNYYENEDVLQNNFDVIVSGACLLSDTSNYFSIIHNLAPSIIKAPVYQSVCPTGTATFSVVAIGTNITYQWRMGTLDLIDDARISGSTTANLTIDNITESDSGEYNVVISGVCMPDAISNNVRLYVGTIPTITTQPSGQRVCAGEYATFSVIATGSNYGYRWRRGTVDLVNGENISGANTRVLTILPVNSGDAANDYNVLIYGSCFLNVISENTSLIVDTEPTIITQPTDQVVCVGSSTSFSVLATGTGLTYQWLKGTVELTDGINYSGANSPTLILYNVTASDIADNYNVVIKGICAPHKTSQNVSLSIDITSTITSQPVDKTVCEGNAASFSVTMSGTNNTYQWRKGTVNLINGGTISGANSATLTINPVNSSDASSNYNVIVSGQCLSNNASTEISSNASLVVETVPEIRNASGNQTVCIGSAARFSVTASGTALTYQWRKGTVNLVNGGNISGVNTAELTINPVSSSDASNSYNVVVSGKCQASITSFNVSLDVNGSTTITNEPANQTVCIGSPATFSVTTTGTALTYQWRRGTVNLINSSNISGVKTATLTINAATNNDAANNYNVVVGSECISNRVSLNASLALNSSTIIYNQPTNKTACEGSSTSFSVSALGTNLTYQWRKGSVNLTDGGTISGANSAVLIINSVSNSDAASNYNVVVSGECLPNITSSDVSLTVNSIPTITLEPSDQTVCAGSPVSFTVAATGSGLSYQWRKGNANVNNSGTINGATSQTLTISSASSANAATNYNVVVSGACSPNKTSTNAYLAVNTAPAIINHPVDQTVCENGCPIYFNVSATGTGIAYQWRKGAVNLVDGGTISGANSSKLSINPANNSDVSSQYNVVISGVCSSAITSTNATLSGWVSSPNLSDNGENKILVYPNPFTTSLNIMINNFAEVKNCELRIFNIVGQEVVNTTITNQLTTLVTSNLRTGFYFYKVIGNDKIIQSGKLVLRK